MFGTGRFNILRFDVYVVEGEDFVLGLDYVETYNCLIATGENTLLETVFNEVVSTRADGSPAALARAAYEEAYLSGAATVVRFYAAPAMAEAVRAASAMSHNAGPTVAFIETLPGAWFLGHNRIEMAVIAEAIRASHGLSVDHIYAAAFRTIVDAQVTTMLFDITYAVIDVDLPPGSTLVIDSDSYTVLLDGENIIDRHSGAWLRLNRHIFDVVIEGAEDTAGLQTQILYQEKWL